MDDTNTSTGGGGSKALIVVIVLVLLALVGFAVMSRRQQQTTPAMQVTPTATAVTPTAVATEAMTKETGTPSGTMTEGTKIAVSAKNFSFDKKEIRVKKGEAVSVTLTSTGGFHDFVVDEFDAATKQVNTGQSDTVTFTPNKTGTFEFYCSVGNHRAMGMVGKLIVE